MRQCAECGAVIPADADFCDDPACYDVWMYGDFELDMAVKELPSKPYPKPIDLGDLPF